MIQLISQRPGRPSKLEVIHGPDKQRACEPAPEVMPSSALVRSWDGVQTDLPLRVIQGTARRGGMSTGHSAAHANTGPLDQPFDFCRAMRKLCQDIAGRCQTFKHIDV